MPATLVGQVAVDNAAGPSASVAVSVPTSGATAVRPGDVLVLLASVIPNNGDPTGFAVTGGGWRTVVDPTASGTVTGAVLVRTWQTGDPTTFNVSWQAGSRYATHLLAWVRGATEAAVAGPVGGRSSAAARYTYVAGVSALADELVLTLAWERTLAAETTLSAVSGADLVLFKPGNGDASNSLALLQRSTVAAGTTPQVDLQYPNGNNNNAAGLQLRMPTAAVEKVHDAGQVVLPGRARATTVTAPRRDTTATAPARSRLTAASAARRDVATTAPARARLTAATAARRDVATALPGRARVAAATSARRDVEVLLPARARLAAALAAARDVDVVLPTRARLAAAAAAARATDVRLPVRAALQVAVETSRVADVALGLPVASRLRVDLVARRDAAVQLGAAARAAAATAARRDVDVALPARGRLEAAVDAVRAVAPSLPARARLGAHSAATRALDVVLRAAARLDALVVGRRPVPTSTDGDLVATVGPPEPGWWLTAPAARWHLQHPTPGWHLGPPTHQPGGDRWN